MHIHAYTCIPVTRIHTRILTHSYPYTYTRISWRFYKTSFCLANTWIINTYCDIGVYFILLPIFTDKSTAELVHARRHYLKPLMALGEDGFERFDFLLESVQTGHLRSNKQASARVLLLRRAIYLVQMREHERGYLKCEKHDNSDKSR